MEAASVAGTHGSHAGVHDEEHRGVEVPGIYWHFVDVMWVIVYLSVYII